MEVSGATPLHGSSTNRFPLGHMSAQEIHRAEMEEWDQEVEQLLTPIHTETKRSLLKTQTGQMRAKLTHISETPFGDGIDEAAHGTNIPVNRRVSYGETAKRASFGLGNKKITYVPTKSRSSSTDMPPPPSRKPTTFIQRKRHRPDEGSQVDILALPDATIDTIVKRAIHKMTAKQTRPEVSKRRSDVDVSDIVRQLDQLSRIVTTLETKEASRVVEMPARVEKAIQVVQTQVQEVDRQGTSKWNALLADHRGLDERMNELEVQVNTLAARMEQQEAARRQDCAELQRREAHHEIKLEHRISTLEKEAHEGIPRTQNQILESRVERAEKWIDKLEKTLDVHKGAATHEVDSLGARIHELERQSVRAPHPEHNTPSGDATMARRIEEFSNTAVKAAQSANTAVARVIATEGAIKQHAEDAAQGAREAKSQKDKAAEAVRTIAFESQRVETMAAKMERDMISVKDVATSVQEVKQAIDTVANKVCETEGRLSTAGQKVKAAMENETRINQEIHIQIQGVHTAAVAKAEAAMKQVGDTSRQTEERVQYMQKSHTQLVAQTQGLMTKATEMESWLLAYAESAKVSGADNRSPRTPQGPKSPSPGTVDTTALRVQLDLVYATKMELASATAAQNKSLEDASSALNTNLARVENMQNKMQCEKATKSEVAQANENHARAIQGVSESVQESIDRLDQANIKIHNEKVTREEFKTQIGTLTQQLQDSDKDHRADRERLGEAIQDLNFTNSEDLRALEDKIRRVKATQNEKVDKAHVESRLSHIEELQKEKADKTQVEQAMQDVRAQIAAFTVSRVSHGAAAPTAAAPPAHTAAHDIPGTSSVVLDHPEPPLSSVPPMHHAAPLPTRSEASEMVRPYAHPYEVASAMGNSSDEPPPDWCPKENPLTWLQVAPYVKDGHFVRNMVRRSADNMKMKYRVRPTGVPDDMRAFKEVRAVPLMDELQKYLKDSGEAPRTEQGMFGTQTNSWLDPQVNEVLKKMAKVPTWDCERATQEAWIKRFNEWRADYAERFDEKHQSDILLAALTNEDVRDRHAKNRRREGLSLEELWQDITGRRMVNIHKPGAKWRRRALPNEPLTTLSWTDFMNDWSEEGSLVRGGVTHRQARDRLIKELRRHVKECPQDAATKAAYNKIYRVQADHGGLEFNYWELFMHVMPFLSSAEYAEMEEEFLTDEAASVRAVSRERSRSRGRDEHRSRRDGSQGRRDGSRERRNGSRDRHDDRRQHRDGTPRSPYHRRDSKDRSGGETGGRGPSQSRYDDRRNSPHGSVLSSRSHITAKLKSEGRCFNCKSKDHTQKDCPHKLRCYNCDATDHTSKDCLQPDRRKSGQDRGRSPGRSSADGRPRSGDRRSERGHTPGYEKPPDRERGRSRSKDRYPERGRPKSRSRSRESRSGSKPRSRPQSKDICKKCGGKGHWAQDCPSAP